MEELRNTTLKKLHEKLLWTKEEFIEWLQHVKLLHSKRTCECGKSMGLKSVQEGREYPKWHCDKKSCKKEKGFLVVTFFEGTHLSLQDIFKLSYFWAWDVCDWTWMEHEFQRDDGTTIGRHAWTDLRSFFREVAEQYFVRNPVKVGGPGRHIQIDETFISRRKYNRGRAIADQVIVFGGVEDESGEVFIWPVKRRDAVTLLGLLRTFVYPGTIITSDCWTAYGGIERLPEGYQHYTVNHSQNFVDPETGAKTQRIESEWQKFKTRHKREFGTKRELLLYYISEYVWKKKFKGPDVMFYLWSHVAELYPVENK